MDGWGNRIYEIGWHDLIIKARYMPAFLQNKKMPQLLSGHSFKIV